MKIGWVLTVRKRQAKGVFADDSTIPIVSRLRRVDYALAHDAIDKICTSGNRSRRKCSSKGG